MEMRAAFLKLCHDETPMVRRAAAQVRLACLGGGRGRLWGTRQGRASAACIFCTPCPPSRNTPPATHTTQPGTQHAAATAATAAAGPQALAPFAEALEAQHIREDILPAFVDLTRDDQDSVRLIAVEAAGALARVLSRGEVASSAMPAVVQCSQDKSWRVRYNAVQQVGRAGSGRVAGGRVVWCLLSCWRARNALQGWQPGCLQGDGLAS